MSKRSIFFDAWQACLRAHYVHVIRTNDAVTEPTLRSVLLQSGLSEDELHALYQEALALGPVDPDTVIMPEPDVEPLPDVLPEPEPEPDELSPEDIPDPALDEQSEIEEAAEEATEIETIEDIDEASAPPDEPPPAQQLSMF